jgi:hypothetical protein
MIKLIPAILFKHSFYPQAIKSYDIMLIPDNKASVNTMIVRRITTYEHNDTMVESITDYTK